MKKYLTYFITLLIGISIGVGTTLFVSKQQSTPQSEETVAPKSEDTTTSLANEETNKVPIIKVSQEAAIKQFTRLYSTVKISNIDLKIENGNYIYTLEGFDERKDCTMQIDATNDKIIGQSTIRHGYDTHEQEALNLNKCISRSEASKVALQHTNGGQARAWNLSNEKEMPIWTISVVNDNEVQEVKFNAETKEIITD